MTSARSSLKSLFARHEFVLLAVIVLEVILFQQLGRRFLDGANVSNIFRHSVEIGLLALAMTPVILTGGIDLSVGSMMGLCAVCFGMLVKQAEMSPLLAGVLSIGIGALGGGLNAFLIARMKLPPLIVTLGTFSLFRGLAEALTEGSKSYSGFSPSFLALGNSDIAGIPAQLWIFLVVAIGIWLLVHRTTLGRSFRAIGYSPEGSRYAGIPVERNVSLAYILAGAVAGLAAVILVSRLGEARANAGIGYELLAITAVVLGGTSIFGGSGTIAGTLLGYLAIAILNNGLKRITAHEIFDRPISSVSNEMSGMLTGVLLLVALAAVPVLKSIAARRSRAGT
ncbi:ABC transporter permease [Luteolibacter flavescens]|uniref:Autoinducer 2 import system permease protein LsrD n=1 Tax=Luteolibacter flavescens TaxID=1859460 RepID=A0ABT3FJQ7_9BACT|nr:ABC transporter permease [Luteolibacter flavescens]MCW1883796.1 ABC transporter permease [Luteolibacter flavescens]